MPQAIERSLATPITRPCLPSIRFGASGRSTALDGVWVEGLAVPPPEASGAAERVRSLGMMPLLSWDGRSRKMTNYCPAFQQHRTTSAVVTREQQAGVGAAKPEAVRHHGLQAGLVDTLARHRIVADARIDILDVGRGRDEVFLHHQQRIDRLVRAGRTLAVPGQRLGRADGRQLVVAE